MKNVEDIYPLSPVQQGMLFHAAMSPEKALYLEQKVCTLTGDMDRPAFQQAWQQVLQRHPILRTCFLWKGLEKPLQVVRQSVMLPWVEEDWRDKSAEEQQQLLDQFLQEDRRIPLDLSNAPLMRMGLFRTGEETYQFVWMHHHILLDGWSLPVILKEVMGFYEANRAGQTLQLGPGRSYKSYIAWLQKQDLTDAEAFWKRELAGFTKPTSLKAMHQSAGRQRASHNGNASHSDQDQVYGDQHVVMSEEESVALQEAARNNQLTVNTFAQGAWALLLAHYSNDEDVLFGGTVSGRPADLPGVEEIVGLFINTLPVRVKVDSNLTVIEWLSEIQRQQVEARQFDYSPLSQVQSWSSIPRGDDIFNSFLVFDNYPEETNEGPEPSLQVSNFRAIESGNYELVIKVHVAAGHGLGIATLHDTRCFSDSTITRVLNHMRDLLKRMTEEPTAKLSELQQSLTEAERNAKMIKKKKRKQTDLSAFGKSPSAGMTMTAQELTKKSYLNDDQYPLVIEPTVADVDLVGWAADNRATLNDELLKHGAILFRGFGIKSVGAFEGFAKAICSDLYGDYGDLPEEKGDVYKSTPYPEDKAILFHNESSHMESWPTKQFFCCLKAAEERGETPIIDCRRVYKTLDPAIVRNFEEKQLMYVRNFVEGLDVPWEHFFHTEDKATVEANCRSKGISFEWTENNGLRLKQLAPGVITHPKTGEKSFFNQVQLHHPFFLDAETRESMAALFSEDQFPRNVTYGDGTPIEDGVMDEILNTYWDNCVHHAWQEGDVVMLDNMISAHARNPYKGTRKIIVALAELTRLSELESSVDAIPAD